MEPQPPERMQFPHVEVIPILTSLKDLALKGLHFIGDAIRHETPSEHFVHDPLLDTPDHNPWVNPPE